MTISIRQPRGRSWFWPRPRPAGSSCCSRSASKPTLCFPTDIDETPQRNELPRSLAPRLAEEKAAAAVKIRALPAGTRRLLYARRRHGGRGGPAHSAQMRDRGARPRMPAASVGTPAPGLYGRQPDHAARAERRRARRDAAALQAACPRPRSTPISRSGEWRGKAGGYAIQGLAGAVPGAAVGSYSAVVGLPLYETVALLAGEGYPVLTPWFESERARSSADVTPRDSAARAASESHSRSSRARRQLVDADRLAEQFDGRAARARPLAARRLRRASRNPSTRVRPTGSDPADDRLRRRPVGRGSGRGDRNPVAVADARWSPDERAATPSTCRHSPRIRRRRSLASPECAPRAERRSASDFFAAGSVGLPP